MKMESECASVVNGAFFLLLVMGMILTIHFGNVMRSIKSVANYAFFNFNMNMESECVSVVNVADFCLC